MMGNQKFYIGVKALISDDEGRILLLRKVPSKSASGKPSWDLPGGRIASGNIKQTLLREAKEELGQPITVGKIAFAAIPDFRLNDGKDGLMFLVYNCSVRPKARFRLSKEHDRYEWVAVKDARKRLTFMLPPESLRELGR